MSTLLTSPTSTSASIDLSGHWVGQYLQLTKARLSALVLFTTAVGYVVASPGPIDWLRLCFTIVGTGLAAGSASAFNQVMEVARDRRMLRTRSRPLPSGAMGLHHANAAAILMGTVGVTLLTIFVNLDAAWMAMLTILLYAVVYTPLKTRTTLNTLVGAVCGALPPMIGWVAATGRLDIGAWALGAILFIWQLPHFLALAWLYRADYQRGGYVMLPVTDRSGQMTCNIIVLTSLMLVPVGLMMTLLGVTGYWFAAGATILAAWMTILALRLHRSRDDGHARGVFLASIMYLALLMCLMVLDCGPVPGAASLRQHAATLAMDHD